MATNLFLLVAITAGTLFCITIAGIPYVNGRQSTVLAVVVITAAGNVAANAFVYSSFNHNRCPPCHLLAVSNQIEPGFDGKKSLNRAGFSLEIRTVFLRENPFV